MWYMQSVIVLVCCALVSEAAVARDAAEGEGVATTRAPLRTLDRAASELAWRSWLQSPESTNQNAPPRRITTKSLFITPLVCPKGQRLDRNACVQVVTVGKEDHERILLEQLNALFTSAPSGDVVYDYGDLEPGPLQLSLPIGFDPQAAPLQAQDPSVQAQELQPTYVKIDKKQDYKNTDASLEAELELLQLQHHQNNENETVTPDGYGADILNRNVLNIDKPKRDSPDLNSTEIKQPESEIGQKEVIYGQINVDPILFQDTTENQDTTTDFETQQTTTDSSDIQTETTTSSTNDEVADSKNTILANVSTSTTKNNSDVTKVVNSTTLVKKAGDQDKLSPEIDYADIGEAIKLISRYAEVITDNSFTKNQKKYFEMNDDSILGTRTKMQHRRNKQKPSQRIDELFTSALPEQNKKTETHPEGKKFYRYPWPGQHSQTPPPDYPFKHIQDYWKGRNKIGGLYNTPHENPRRHHHAISENYFRPHGLPYGSYAQAIQNFDRAQFPPYVRRALPRHTGLRSHSDDPNLYTLLGLKHWFSSEGTSKR